MSLLTREPYSGFCRCIESPDYEQTTVRLTL